MIYKKRFSERTINKLNRDIIQLYLMYKQDKKIKEKDIIKKISNDIEVPVNKILLVLQQNDYVQNGFV